MKNSSVAVSTIAFSLFIGSVLLLSATLFSSCAASRKAKRSPDDEGTNSENVPAVNPPLKQPRWLSFTSSEGLYALRFDDLENPLEVLLAPDFRNESWLDGPTWSPQGRHLAFVAMSLDRSQRVLWVASATDDFEPKEITRQPFEIRFEWIARDALLVRLDVSIDEDEPEYEFFYVSLNEPTELRFVARSSDPWFWVKPDRGAVLGREGDFFISESGTATETQIEPDRFLLQSLPDLIGEGFVVCGIEYLCHDMHWSPDGDYIATCGPMPQPDCSTITPGLSHNHLSINCGYRAPNQEEYLISTTLGPNQWVSSPIGIGSTLEESSYSAARIADASSPLLGQIPGLRGLDETLLVDTDWDDDMDKVYQTIPSSPKWAPTGPLLAYSLCNYPVRSPAGQECLKQGLIIADVRSSEILHNLDFGCDAVNMYQEFLFIDEETLLFARHQQDGFVGTELVVVRVGEEPVVVERIADRYVPELGLSGDRRYVYFLSVSSEGGSINLFVAPVTDLINQGFYSIWSSDFLFFESLQVAPQNSLLRLTARENPSCYSDCQRRHYFVDTSLSASEAEILDTDSSGGFDWAPDGTGLFLATQDGVEWRTGPTLQDIYRINNRRILTLFIPPLWPASSS